MAKPQRWLAILLVFLAVTSVILAETQRVKGITMDYSLSLLISIFSLVTNVLMFWFSLKQYLSYKNRFFLFLSVIFGYTLFKMIIFNGGEYIFRSYYAGMLEMANVFKVYQGFSMVLNYFGALGIPLLWLYALWTYREGENRQQDL